LSFKYPKHISYECEKCALCCSDTENKSRAILLLKSETNRISEKSSLSLYEFAERIEGSDPYVYCMKKTKDQKCIFLQNSSCSIYQIRPLICKFYPFQLKNPRTNEYIFEYTQECPGIGKGPQLKKAFFEQLFKDFIESMKKNMKVYNY
jgi:Fe-S-cluster containining protein